MSLGDWFELDLLEPGSLLLCRVVCFFFKKAMRNVPLFSLQFCTQRFSLAHTYQFCVVRKNIKPEVLRVQTEGFIFPAQQYNRLI